MKEPKITSRGDDEIVLQLPGVDGEELKEIKRLLEKTGDLKLYAVAGPEQQERYERDHVVPDGYRIVGASLLVEAAPVIEGRHVIAAEPHPDAGVDGIQWVTLFDLDTEGSRRFDEAAERLYRRQPRGRIAIVLDGVVRSTPVVNSPAFHGRGQISSAVQERK
jgi:preprotein translocase subunit SecD